MDGDNYILGHPRPDEGISLAEDLSVAYSARGKGIPGQRRSTTPARFRAGVGARSAHVEAYANRAWVHETVWQSALALTGR
jgi:hypothetical protein